MKSIVLSFLITCCMALTAIGQTAAEWQQDLRHLQQTVHAKYANLFHTITAADWDKAVDKFYEEIPSLNNTSRLVGFMKLVGLFRVGHTQVSTWQMHQSGSNAVTLNRYPYQLYWFSDGLYVIAADKNYETAVGGKITSIGKMKTADALEAIRPIVSYENEQGYKSNCVHYLAIPEYLKALNITESDQEVPVVISKNGKEETVTFKSTNINYFSETGLGSPAGWGVAKKTGTVPLWQKEPAAYRYFEYLPSSKTVYVRHSVVLNDGDKTIADFFAKVFDFIDKNDVQRLILDIRMNGGGNNYLNKNVITGIIASRKINQKGKFFCILGRRTFSAAQNLTNELERYTEVIFVGEPTSENVNFYGDTKTEILPNSKLPINLSWMWWQNMDPRDKRQATYPQLAADMSFADYYNNNDPALQLAMNYDASNNLMSKLTSLLEGGKKEEALRFASAYYKDPVNKYYLDRMEPDLNNEGYRLLNEGKKEIASQMFEVNMKLFPESANTYDSYAESLMLMEKNEEAIKYYEMAIAKDKDGVTASNSKTMIEKIKKKKGF